MGLDKVKIEGRWIARKEIKRKMKERENLKSR